MSEAVSALKGKSHTGFATVAEAGLTGMVSVRADLGSAALAAGLGALGLSVPGQRQVVAGGARSVAWMSPDELMIFCGYAEAGQVVAGLVAALGAEHSLVVDVSDMRSVFTITGAKGDEVREQARGYYETARERGREYYDDAAERLDEAQRYVVERVQERPLQSTAIALGVGMVLGLLLAGRRR
jgi:ElaB/YqjD/DUF883 family membrane-anchored ribosome-binding protein